MFSQELENLIQATLEDGKLEQYEKDALVKRAQAEGVDLTELEIYIQSILQRRQRELNEKKNAELSHKVQAAEEKKAEELKALGYKECPKCHRQVAPLTLVCECGFEFTNAKSMSSIQQLSNKIAEIEGSPLKNTKENTPEYKAEIKQRNRQIINLIQLHPVPNTKEDIVDFLALAAPNARRRGGLTGTKKGRMMLTGIIAAGAALICLMIGGKHSGVIIMWVVLIGLTAIMVIGQTDDDTTRYNDRAIIWRAKFDQVLMKGRSLRADAEFRQTLDYYENMINQK